MCVSFRERVIYFKKGVCYNKYNSFFFINFIIIIDEEDYLEEEQYDDEGVLEDDE